MNVELIPLKKSDSGEMALQQMEANRVLHFPIVQHNKFKGLISEKDIISSGDIEEKVGNMKISMPDMSVGPFMHIIEVLSFAVENQLTLIPVVDEDSIYMGALSLPSLREAVGDITASDSPGSIIVIEMSQNDYYLSEITQLVESENARILCLFLKTYNDSTKLEVNIKINKLDPERILAALRRYDYQVKAYWTDLYDEEDQLKTRYDSLMKYLDI